MSQPPIPRPPGSRGAVVTPPQAQEAGIDFEEARRISEEALRLDDSDRALIRTGTGWDGKPIPVEWSVALVRVARAYLALLATHRCVSSHTGQ